MNCRKQWFILSFIFIFGLLSFTDWPMFIANAAKLPVKTGFEAVFLYPELAEDLGLTREQPGLIITGVYQGSPAEQAGISEGDLIIKVQALKGKTVEIKDVNNYSAAINAIPAAKPVIFTVRRKAQELTIQLTRSSDKFGPLVQPPVAEKPSLIKVAADKSGNYRTIDGAMLNALPGDTLLLGNGKFPFVNIGRDNITIRSLDPQNSAVLPGVNINGVTGTKLENLTFVSATTGSGSGISGTGVQTIISNCQIRGFLYGINLSGTELTIEGNTLNENDLAILVDSGASPLKISHNLIFKNSGGIWASGQAEISNNTIIENRISAIDFITRLYKSRDITGVGVKITAPGSYLVFNNIIAYNNVGCLIVPNTRVTLEFNDIFQNSIEQATIKTGWAFNDNQASIPACNANIISQINIETKEINGSYYGKCTPALIYQLSATNISADPLFTDAMKGDYRLASDSPLIQKGRGNNYIGAFPPLTPKAETETQNKPPVFGIAARPLTDIDHKTLGLATQNGLWITEIKKGSLADKLQIKVDDVILDINGTAFKDIEEFKKLISAATINSVKVFRGGIEIVLVMPTDF